MADYCRNEPAQDVAVDISDFRDEHRGSVQTFSRFLYQLANVCVLILLTAALNAQQSATAEVPSAPNSNIASAWESVLGNPAAPPTADPALNIPQVEIEKWSAGDFLNHAFFETRTEYRRTQTSFSGQPTITGVIDVPPGQIVNPNGIPYPGAFQPSTNSMYSFLNWGTRGWLSDRINTDFAFRYQQDITPVDPGSPALGVLNTFYGNRELQLLSGYVDISGKPTDGFFSGSSLRVGRQDVYGAELADFDGLSFSMNRQKFSYTLYGGRRFTYYSDPAQRGIGGGNFIFRVGGATIEYDALLYVRPSQALSYHQQFSHGWLLSGQFRMFGGSPTNAGGSAIWTPADGKTTIRLNFSQEITNKDYVYDYTGIARDLDPHNPLQRLNLGVFSPHSQVVIDARRVITSRLRLGGSVWIRRLNDSKNQGAFDTSFQDYRANAEIFPGKKVTVFLDFHQRNSDRRNPASPVTFDDISAAGETRVQDVDLELGRSFGEGRFKIKAGAFYRLLNFQDSFFVTNRANDKGVLGSATVKLDQRTRLFVEYDLDTDFPVYRPDIQNTQTLRVGMAWRY